MAWPRINSATPRTVLMADSCNRSHKTSGQSRAFSYEHTQTHTRERARRRRPTPAGGGAHPYIYRDDRRPSCFYQTSDGGFFVVKQTGSAL